MKEPSGPDQNKALTQMKNHAVDSFAHQSLPPRYGYDMESTGTENNGYARLQEYWRAIRKHVWLILGIMGLITALATIYMARQPDIYESHSRVQVDLEVNNPAIGAMKTNSVVLNTPFQDPTYFNTQMQILSSTGLLSRVVKSLDLEHNQSFLHPQAVQNRSTWDNIRRIFGGEKKSSEQAPAPVVDQVPLTSSIAPATSRDDLVEVNRLAPYVEMLQGGLSVKQVTDTRLIDISFKHSDPEIAAKVVNTIAETFVLSNLERKTETGINAGDFLQKRIAELQSDIRKGEEELINYAKNHQILSLDASQNTVVDRLTGLNKQLLEAENERKMAEAAFRAAQSPGAAAALAETGAKQSADIETKLAELRQKRAQLLIEYTEKYPEVKEIDQQIAVLDKQAREMKTNATSVVMTNLETRYRQALAREQSLRTAFEQQRGETLTQNEAAVNYRIIQQEIETNKSLLDGLLQRAKETDVVLAGTPNNIHVVDYAPKPKGPVGPRRLQAILLAALFSLVFGVGLARYLEYLDDSVHTVDDVEKMVRLPALAVIPAIGTLTRRRLLPGFGNLQKRNGGMPELLLSKDVRSPLAEAYRQLRTSVLLSSAGGAPKTLLVTSSQPAEGKTTTVVNTAAILSQTGANVLVIDADMRRPRMHSIFEMQNAQGLSTILANKMSEDEMLALLEQHEESGLHVLTSGPIPPNPAELLGSDQMRRLIAVLESTFTHIVIDSPPVASFTDGVLLSSLADGVLLVVHGGKASRAIVKRSRQLLQDVGAKIFGVILNNVNLRANDYYYHYYYGHYYSKSDEVDNAA